MALPAPYANASAEQFAAGGVHLLAALGCDTLAFGAETPEPAPLQAAAAALCSAAFPAALRSQLESGLPLCRRPCRSRRNIVPRCCGFAANAQQHFGDRILQGHSAAGAAMRCCPCRVWAQPMAPPRPARYRGRHWLRLPISGSWCIRKESRLPAPCAAGSHGAVPQAAEQGQLADPEKFSTAVLTLLRTKTPEQLSTLRGAGEGLENRLYAAAREAETVNDLYDRLKTKRYPTARLRRLVLDAVLDVPAAGLPALPPVPVGAGGKAQRAAAVKARKNSGGYPALRVWRGRTKNCKLLLICTAKRLIFRYFAGTKYSPWGLRTRRM